MAHYDTPTVTIQLYSSKERFDLTIEEVHEGERDQSKNLTQEGGISFRTPKGKKWFLRFSEFGFVLNEHTPAQFQAQPLLATG